MTSPAGGFDMSNIDMNGLLAQAQAMQAQLAQAQQELAESTFSGAAGGGLVNAVVTGSGELTSLEIKPEAVDPEDTETLADLIVAAVRDATAKATAKQASMMPQIPGLGM
ncbi:YbaB/EbfC family nucleoid-associated protein [Acidipropionibacterium jensenii]|uniref:Nucleoid-associated protein C0Z10_11155 n=1 Tax=Acidipropionibacterium jensenii TaxID=1749 RepID=A0A3Q9UJG8_9ACTN|nr:YbaB/EbfC family nucleoid-associated protein [Acidipropionibacterium jensenii]AZZ40218.1 nucleoid-associated protein, YbaB/EbfC family [Acidipropionibacterium jensenii]AZZ41391.1 nucleoid-associated protein, YbaB/EbfC family [Acidipropionibacterium jensenii]MDN5977343.1 YbaB/EbfC family nucleoid-associated protein [Acidipropionibacterium jensenii]MDN5996550.1 YbaB/EbfC family nucleoid-associated protein [Acidipropionibacterium jensenii]MDN6425848.1 YbaB/EbfC family nucleoid-associated prote